jgi:lipopolysaccharide/colanic/teichoic acid biosynthesis glycosyltransferase
MIAPETLTASSVLTDTDTHRPLRLPVRRRSEKLKRAFDVVLGLPMLVLSIPVIAVTWMAVRLTSAGPGFYSQVRVGRNGRHYRIYKVRTMYHNCEKGSGATWCTRHDPRITPVGRILRKLHLDELPQLWNVLLGDMSLVGPRPERPEFVKPLSEAIPGYGERHLVRPGVTGLAQIQLPSDTDFESVRTKLVLDQCYVGTGSIWLDLRVMLGTAVYLLGFSYDRVRRVMRLPNPLVDGTSGDSAGSVLPAATATPVTAAPAPVKPQASRQKGTGVSDRDPVACGRE